MRILSIIDRLCTPGGAERQLVTLTRALTARGHQCTIAALFPGSDLASDLPAWGIGFHELRVRSRRDLTGAGIKVARLVRRGNFDVVQAHLITSSMALGLSRTLVDGPARVVVLHDLDFKDTPPAKIRHKVFLSSHLFCLRRFIDGVVAVSDSVARHYKDKMGIEGITVIPNSIELGNSPEVFLTGKEELRKKLGADEGTYLLVYSARMVEKKRHFLLLRVLEILRRRGLSPKLLLIGKGPLETTIRAEIARAGLENQVIMTGNLPHPEALRHIKAADLFVSPSSQEGHPLAPAEAMALGIPVVATAVPGVLDLVEDGVSGLLVPPEDPEALADAVARALSDRDLRHRLQIGAPEWIRKHFAPTAIAERWETYFGKVLASRQC